MADAGQVPQMFASRTKFRSTHPLDSIDIALGHSGVAAETPITVSEMINGTVGKIPNGVALSYKLGDRWSSITYQQYYDLCISAAKSFIKLGLKPSHAVVIIGFNACEWHISCLGAIFAGGIACGTYATNSAEASKYIAGDCRATVAVVEDEIQLNKFLEIRSKLPELKAIVQYRGIPRQQYRDVYNWEQFMGLGKHVETSVVERVMQAQTPNQCASLVYTSGTTGNPKGTMLSHDNLTWTAKALASTSHDVKFGVEHFVSYLPLSHIAAQMADIYFSITVGACCHFAQPDALKGTLVETLREVQPTQFFAVPRVYEKMMERMQEMGATVTGVKRVLADWAKRKGLDGNQNFLRNESMPWGWSLANMLVFKKVREALGFQRCKGFGVGAAPIKMETLEYFMSLNIPIRPTYGMSESSGPHSLCKMDPSWWNPASVGKDMPGVQTKIFQPDSNGEGEVCFRGRHVFMGYLNNWEKTAEAIDDEGWLHSGDMGRIDEKGFLHITGRFKGTQQSRLFIDNVRAWELQSSSSLPGERISRQSNWRPISCERFRS
jgi:long-chain-fatty-acid--CoA ligase ACSBG